MLLQEKTGLLVTQTPAFNFNLISLHYSHVPHYVQTLFQISIGMQYLFCGVHFEDRSKRGGDFGLHLSQPPEDISGIHGQQPLGLRDGE